MNQAHLQTAQQVATRFAQLPDVQAVAIAGSHMSGTAGPNSDIDVYIYSHAEIPVEVRTAIGAEFSDHVEIVDYWGPGNEWDDRATGVHVDAVFWTVEWIEDQLDRTLNRHQAWMGYTTCFWHTVQISKCLFDRDDWFARLQQTADQPYPDGLVEAIVRLNRPLLRGIAPSFLRQLEKAAARQDLVSLNHRAAALLASYFDILFAINQQLHPGEKRLIAFAEQHCPKRPTHLRKDIEALLQATVNPPYRISDAVHQLCDPLDELLAQDGLLE